MRVIIALLFCAAVVSGLVIPQDNARQARRLDSNEWDPAGQQRTNSDEDDHSGIENFEITSNTTAQNLYVIKAVVYEVGILTDVDENDTSTNETLKDEQIDFTFFNPERNGSILNLGNIPLPIQTNISGKLITGIAPINLGILSASDVTNLNSSDVSGLFSFANSLSHLTPSISINTQSADDHIEDFNVSIPGLENQHTFEIPNNSTILQEHLLPINPALTPPLVISNIPTDSNISAN